MKQEHVYSRSALLLVLTTAACASTPPARPAEQTEGQKSEVRSAEPVRITPEVAKPAANRAEPLILDKSSAGSESNTVLAVVEGEATYYASKFDGRRTANGIVFRNSAFYAAHRTYPFGTVVRVTNVRNGRSVDVRVVDRGPWGSKEHQKRTIIDLSQRAARELGFMERGRTRVRVEVLEWGDGESYH